MADHLISGEELLRLSKGAKILSYDELNNYDNIDDVFGKGNKIALLYVTQVGDGGKIGHWTSLTRRGNEIEFSDPYSFQPDVQFKFIPKDIEQESGQERGLLSRLLLNHLDQGGKVTYNEKQMQSKKQGMSTCGRHAALRLYFSDVPLDEFQKQMDRIKQSGKSVDDFVLWWSKNKIGV